MKRVTLRLATAAVLGAALLGGPGASAGESPTRLVTDREARRWHPELRDAYEFARTRTGDVSFAVVDMKGLLEDLPR